MKKYKILVKIIIFVLILNSKEVFGMKELDTILRANIKEHLIELRVEHGLSQVEVAKITGISRSAYYKYRDAILPFQNMMNGRIITFQFLLHDEQGVLSTILTDFAQMGANILTINSIIPTNGCALVTISAETTEVSVTLEELLSRLQEIPNVLKAEILAG